MKNVKFVNLAVVAAAGFCLCASHLSAWERTAMSNCKKNEQECKKDAKKCTDEPASCKQQKEKCKMHMEGCKKDAATADTNSFAAALSNSQRSQFNKMSMDQKKQVMDWSDGNKMNPDDAVVKMMKKNSQ